ncbi:MAG TPA: hypothetical protein VNF50_11005 [Acidimicrobiales bacterium]|nr:hypothetical protein [Acidimicrobiales bacterium]
MAPPRLGVVQAAVYAAEAEALEAWGQRWSRVRQAQAYADGLVGREWFAARWPHFGRCHVERRGSGARYSTAAALDGDGPAPAGAIVLLAPGHLTQAVLLHELAHVLAGPGEGHSAGFLTVQLELVRNEMGFGAYADYRAALGRKPELAGLMAPREPLQALSSLAPGGSDPGGVPAPSDDVANRLGRRHHGYQ